MSCAIAVMAKAPVPGRCKTRLVPPLSIHDAAALSAAFLRDITENLAIAARHVAITPYVAYAPCGAQSLFDGVVAPGTNLILADGSCDVPDGVDGFGRCLLHAVQTLLAAGHSSVCLLNSDSPTLPTDILIQAAQLLAQPGDRAVTGPADDGGYYLLGMKQVHAHLVCSISWSTDVVAAQTRIRAHESKITLVELESWYDVDDAAALERLHGDLSDPAMRGFAAPRTGATLAALTMMRAAE